ncbi:MAG: hypothetical protein ACREDC_01940 [Bradyrhizobium sp.]
MITIFVRDFRGIADLQSDVPGILLLAGPNGAGKSSAATALGAAASGVLLPFEGITKARANLLVRDGGVDAEATITSDHDAIATVQWPATDRGVRGAWRDVSPVVAGLVDPVRMAPKERAAWLNRMIGAEPTKEQLTAHLTAEGIAPERAAQVWTEIERQSWDGALAKLKEEGAKSKGRWEQITGERYGAAKAMSWRPAGWRSGIDAYSIEDLERAAEHTQQVADDARRAVLVGETKRQDAQKAITAAEQATRELPEAETAFEGAQAAAATAKNVLATIGTAASALWKCPCCGERVALIGRELVKAPSVTTAPKLVAQAQERVRQAEAAALNASARCDRLRALIVAREQAQAVLDALPPMSDADEAQQIVTAATQAGVHLRMKRQAVDASAAHEQIKQTIEIMRILAPEGLRQTILAERLGAFNLTLAALCKIAGWRGILIDPTMTICYGGRPVSLCSAGEQFRVRTTLQVVAAQTEYAAILIVDGADVLDRNGRNGLFKLLRYAAIPSVVGMTLLRRKDMPDLERPGLGRSVWLGDAVQGALAA